MQKFSNENKVATTAQVLEVSHEFLSAATIFLSLYAIQTWSSSEVVIFCQIVQ